ncbi:MAG: DinB family protein [Bacteroidetes bacterium]|nr:MAG: DinB family protein [Bacteroidota bacterium]
MDQVKWIERKFSFDSKENIFPSVVDRLEGTVIRLRHRLQSVDEKTLRHQPEGRWSILEHIGHLADLETLWQTRLEEILEGKETMSAADMTNAKTHAARHNEKEVHWLIREFEDLRNETLQSLHELKEEDVFRSAFHPRLQKPMRIIDLFLFVAEHDDHHLVSIKEIAKTV